MSELYDRIVKRRKKLAQVAKKLKKKFVGLDKVIDRVIKDIEAWYCVPEVMTRPTTVCLWGLTGTGKTDLVRTLVKHLGMSDRFVEIQMTNKGSSQDVWASTLQGLLSGSNVSDNEPGILLLDEIQRFRSKDSAGEEIHDYRFQDVWMLLSDGSFGGASDNKETLMEMILQEEFYDDMREAENSVEPQLTSNSEKSNETAESRRRRYDAIQTKRKFKMSCWAAKGLKKQLRLTESVREIMLWEADKKFEVIEQRMEDQSIYEGVRYDKLLIFIAGNLDEAYQMSKETSEIDVDADIFHKYSLKINILRIKHCLNARFKPEQIARFGNAHVIYPALSRSSYEEIINRRLKLISESWKENSGIRFKVNQSVKDAIYRNGVFPTQGTRPLFSTIASFYETSLPYFVLKALAADVKAVSLFYEGKYLCAKIGGEKVRVKNEGDIDIIRKDKRNEDKIRKVAVHEAGHSVAYALLFGYIPTQVVANVVGDDANGFIGVHEIDQSKQNLKNLIAVYMAGRVAETQVFGEDNVGAGAQGDIASATGHAASYVRRYGMGTHIARMELPANSNQAASNCNNNVEESNEEIEKIVKEQKGVAEKLLATNINLLKALSDYLVINEKIEPDDFKGIFADHDKEVEYLDAKETIYPGYQKLYEEFESRRVADTVV